MIESSFTFTQNILEKSLDAQVLRWNVLANNITNATTPNFKRSDVKFTAALERALSSQQNPYPFEAKMTDSKHIPFFEAVDYHKVMPKIHTEFDNTIMNNGNNVDMEYETAESSKTALLYEATTNMLTRNYNMLNMVLK